MSGAEIRGRYAHHHRAGDDGIVDEIAIERATRGDQTVWLSALERRVAIAELKRRGLPHREIARRLGLADRSVLRIAKHPDCVARYLHPEGATA